jgi:Family of unknown function (DUF6065)
MVSPIRRGEPERYRPQIRAIDDDPDRRARYGAWRRYRASLIAANEAPDSMLQRRGGKGHYRRGMTVTGLAAPEHETTLALAPFVDKREGWKEMDVPDLEKSRTLIERSRRYLIKVGVAASALLARSKPARALSPPPPPPPTGPASAAYSVFAKFEHHGATARFGPLTETGGGAPPSPYFATASSGPVRRIVPVVSGSRPRPSLFLDASKLDAHVAGHRFLAAADCAINSLNLALMLDPPPGAPEPEPFLVLTAERLTATAIFKSGVSADGGAVLSGLAVSGSLVGKRKLKFSGGAAKNQALFQQPHVTITLNRQILEGEVSSGPDGAFEAEEITTYAVEIVLNEADLDGQTVSGEIILGMADAG